MLFAEQFGTNKKEDDVELDLLRLEANWKYYLARGSGDNALTRAIFSVFRKQFCLLLVVSIFTATCQFASPFIVLYLIDYIKNGPTGHTWDEMKDGIYLSIALVLSQGLSSCINEQVSYYQVKVGARAQNMLVAMIYRKHSKISDATNKEFEQGEIVNFVQVDSDRIFWLCYSVSSISRVPFVFLLAFGAFFYYYKWTFLSGFVVIILAVITQTITGVYLSKIQKRLMEAKDARMKVTTEALNYPKMLKLYSWEKNFVKRIQRKRQLEIK